MAAKKKPKGFPARVVKKKLRGKKAASRSKPPKGFSSKVISEAFAEAEKHPHGFRKEIVRAVMKAAAAKLTKKQRAWRRKRRQAKLDALDKARRELRKAEAERKALEKAKASKRKQKAAAAEVRAQAREVEQKAAEIQEQAHAQQRREHGLPVGLPADFTAPANEAMVETWKQSFARLLEVAGRTGQIAARDYGPARTWREKVRSNEREGDMISHRINMTVDETTAEEILYRIQKNADKLPGRRNIWMVSFTFCAMGDSLIGYGNRVLEADNEDDAHNFQMGYENTGVWKTKLSAMKKVRELIEDYASDMTTLIFLNRYTVWNFDYVVGT